MLLVVVYMGFCKVKVTRRLCIESRKDYSPLRCMRSILAAVHWTYITSDLKKNGTLVFLKGRPYFLQLGIANYSKNFLSSPMQSSFIWRSSNFLITYWSRNSISPMILQINLSATYIPTYFFRAATTVATLLRSTGHTHTHAALVARSVWPIPWFLGCGRRQQCVCCAR